MSSVRVGVDIGGTKIAVGCVDSHDAVLARAEKATPRTGGADVMACAADLVAGLLRDGEQTLAGIGVGAPGVIDRRRGRVISATDVLPGWAGTDVAGALATRFEVPVAVDNDVRAATLGEARAGAGAGYGRLLLASFGTGVGGGLVLGGQLQYGPHGTAGEIAHLLAGGDGPVRCGCGRPDHLEAHCSGPAIAAAYHVATGGSADPAPLTVVAARAVTGDAAARGAIAEAGALAGRTLAGLVVAVDVDVVVVTGGVSRIGDGFLTPLRDGLHRNVLPVQHEIPVLAGILGGNAPLIGAAQLVRGTA